MSLGLFDRPRLALQVNGLQSKTSPGALHPELRAFVDLFIAAGWDVELFDWRDMVAGALVCEHLVDALTWTARSEVDLTTAAELMILRAIGSVERDRPRLVSFLQLLEATFSGPIVNQPAWMIRGSDKHYLLDLQSDGWPVIPTVRATALHSVAALCEATPWPLDQTVIKPVYGECGNSVAIGNRVTDAWLEHKRDQVDVWLLQPFVPEIHRGERSLLYIDGEYCYTVLKRPREDDFRNNRRWIDSISMHSPTRAEFDLATSLVESYPEPPHICRVDLVDSSHGPLILEFETVNPSMYIGQVDDSIVTERARARFEALARNLISVRC